MLLVFYVLGDGRFDFDWSKEPTFLVYKVSVLEEQEILGLLSLTDLPSELRLHINLIESSRKHRGKDARIRN